jgi:cysteinyl-tRNA synthetase
MLIYNSLTGKKEKMIIPKNRPLRLFVCGPTVYDVSHIGHARTYIAFDVIARFLRFRGAPLVYLQNITNVDDKIILRAREEKKNPLLLAQYYEKDFKDAMKMIGATSVDIYARASDYIPEIVAQIQTLIRKGHAYEIPKDGWYFRVESFPSYGALSHRKSDDAENSVSRIDESVKKENKADFCLWKFVSVQKNCKIFHANYSGWGTCMDNASRMGQTRMAH